MTAEDVAVETQPQKIEGEKKNVFERVKLRFSSRSKKQKTAKELDTADSMQEVSLTDKDATDNNEKTGKKSTGIEKVKEILKKQQKEEKKEEETPKIQKETSNGNGVQENGDCHESNEEPTNAEEKTEEKKKSSTLVRVKERLSMRKNKKSKDKSNDSTDKKSLKDEKLPKTEANEPEEKLKEENVKTETFVQRILKLFRSKKKQKTSEEGPESKAETGDDSKSECDISDEDKEILAITGDKDETDTPAPTIPQITTTKPPLPGRRLPSSATTSHTRPMSQLDDALKQFRMSTAASRENLRNSRQNLDQMEEQVKVMIRSRPATPLLSLRRETEDSNKQMSSSLQDLRS